MIAYAPMFLLFAIATVLALAFFILSTFVNRNTNATAEHLRAVAQFGYSAAHRRSFRPPTLFDTIEATR